jgi:hypothetical protein
MMNCSSLVPQKQFHPSLSTLWAAMTTTLFLLPAASSPPEICHEAPKSIIPRRSSPVNMLTCQLFNFYTLYGKSSSF